MFQLGLKSRKPTIHCLAIANGRFKELLEPRLILRRDE
jgi:hypothetical protein